jgi:phosphate-selective porin OprO/OprP
LLRPGFIIRSAIVWWFLVLTVTSPLLAEQSTTTACDGSMPIVPAPPSDSPSREQWIHGINTRQGVFVQSPNGDVLLQGHGLLQIDYRTFPGGQNMNNPGVVSSRVVVQRARPTLIACLYREVKVTITPDFGNGLASPPRIFIAMAEWDRFHEARVAYGLQKVPAALEIVQSISASPFMERSLMRNVVPLLAVGGTVSGQFQRDQIEYQVGIWNDTPSGNIFEVGKVFAIPSTFSIRVFIKPFLRDGPDYLKGLGLGVATTQGWIFDTAGQFPMQTETFSYTFFQFNGNVTGGGPRSRYMPQAYWYWERIGVLAQYLFKESRYRLINGPSVHFSDSAWSVQTSIMLTDDHATFGQVTPRRPFSFTTPGGWGAWEIAGRYAQLDLDPIAYSTGFADPTTNAQHARSSTVALNWYPSYSVRFTAHYVHTDFSGTAAYTAASHEDGLMFRMQLLY